MVQASLGKKARPYLQNKQSKKDWRQLPNKCKVEYCQKRQRKKEREEGEGRERGRKGRKNRVISASPVEQI
jgi:hypothetical protein